ncbi:MAG: hypothetical protein AAFO29_11840, partial [Actinomycetota bacterium]
PAHTLPVPTEQPPGYRWLPDEPVFDPDRHLALTEPDEVILLRDLGYDDEEIATKATPVAISSPFRVLSDEGAEVMQDVARRLQDFTARASTRIERSVRGGVYRSQWLRDLCLSPDVTDHLTKIYGVSVVPHPMGLHLGHLNFAPTNLDEAVDKWHHDTLPLDYVMAVTDLRTTPGGQFEFFLGTKHEAAELQAAGRTPPADRVRAPGFPGPGAAVALHGDMVVHRGGPLRQPAERITMVNGYVTLDPPVDEQSRTVDLLDVDDPNVLFTEWARQAAWRSRQRLDRLIDQLPFTDDVDRVTAELQAAIAEVDQAMTEMRSEARPARHYEQ